MVLLDQCWRSAESFLEICWSNTEVLEMLRSDWELLEECWRCIRQLLLWSAAVLQVMKYVWELKKCLGGVVLLHCWCSAGDGLEQWWRWARALSKIFWEGEKRLSVGAVLEMLKVPQCLEMWRNFVVPVFLRCWREFWNSVEGMLEGCMCNFGDVLEDCWRCIREVFESERLKGILG